MGVHFRHGEEARDFQLRHDDGILVAVVTWLTLLLALLVAVFLWRELARRWAGRRAAGPSPLVAPVDAPPPFAVYPDPRRRAAALVPGRADSAAEAPPNELPGYLHRHESVVGGAVEGVATTVFVVRVDLAGEARPLTLPLGVAMLAGSRLVAAVGASGRVTHLREGMFLVSVEGCTPEQTVSHAETLRKAMVGTPLVTSAGDLLPVTCSVSFARFLPGDPALAAPSLDALVERAVSEQETQ